MRFLRKFRSNDAKLASGICPDCGGRMLEGPSGGMSVNLICEDCNALWNYMAGLFPAEKMREGRKV